MKELIKVFDGAVLPIEVINEKEFMIDVSSIIPKSSSKSVAKWKENDRVKKTLNIRKKKFKKNLIETKQGSGGYSKIHNSMLISFARYISVDFEIWCDDTIYDILINSKDEEIKRLKTERKLCMIDSDGFSSIRGISQRTDYTEAQIQEFFVKLGAIEDSIRPTKYWYMKDDINGLLKTRGEFQTPYINFSKATNLLDQYYKARE